MFAPFVATAPAVGATALLTMSSSTEGALPECRAGAANHVAGGEASSKKLTIGYLLCNEEDRHNPLGSCRLGHAWPSLSVGTVGPPLPRTVVEQQHPARGAPARTPAADPSPAAVRDGASAGRLRAGERHAGNEPSKATRDVREPRPSPPSPPRHARPAGQGEHAARLSIPPLRLPPVGRQGGGSGSSEGSIEWPLVHSPQMGRFGGRRQEWSAPAHWAGPLGSQNDRPAPLPPAHPLAPPTGSAWNDLGEKSTQHLAQTDQRAARQEASPARPERPTDWGAQGPALSAPLREASDAASHRPRRLPALWRPPTAAEEDSPSSGCARAAGPDLPRLRPYAPVDGRVARVASWPRSVGGVGSVAGLPYPPRRALRSSGRGLQSVFHGGLPPLLPPSSTSLSLADLQRSPPAAPLSRRFGRPDAGATPADSAVEGGPTAAPDRGPLRQPRQPGGDIKEGVRDRECGSQPPKVQPVDPSNGVSSIPVKVEAPSGVVGAIFPTDKPELDPESATPHACDECSERFPHRSQLQSHVRNVHERAGRPFECERCGSRFRQRAHKQKHVAAVHLKEKPYTCKICLHCFGRRSDLNKHDRLVHKRERPYGCDFPGCHARFGQKGDSKKHMATHERSEARRRAAAAAVVATAAAVAEDAATSTGVAAVDDPPERGRHGDWYSPQERPGAVRDGRWRQTEREWEVEDGDDVDCADKVDDLTRPDNDGGDDEKEAKDDEDDEGSEGLALGMYRA